MIQFIDYEKYYSKEKIVEAKDIKIKEQSISFIMGPNGSGKTTLLKCLLDLEKYNGTILIDGNRSSSELENCLVIWDDCPFYSNNTGLENLFIFGEQKKCKNEILELSKKYLDMNLLKKKVKTYSYGQKKKLALILVDILQPKYLFMDEISNGLDYEMMQELKRHLKELSQKMTIILTGHQFSFYDEVIDELYLIKDKQLRKYDKYSDGNKSLEEVYNEELYL